MTVSNTDGVVVALGNGVTTEWPFNFNIPTAAAVNVVTTVIATGVETIIDAADYTVTGLDDPAGGQVVYPTVASGNPPLASTSSITIYRSVPQTQLVTVSNQTRYDAGVTESVWDRLTMMIQDLNERYLRSVHIKRADTYDGSELHLPIRADRINNLLGFDANGDMQATSPASIGAVVISDVTPAALTDTATAGVSTEISRADHDHGNHFGQGAEVGDPGLESAGINIGGVTYTHSFRINDIGLATPAEFILHRHSTTIEPVFVAARSNSDTTAHAAVTAGQGLLVIYGAGWTGTEYNLFAGVRHSVGTGTVSDTSSPGKLELMVTPDGATVPVAAVTIDSDGSAVFAGTVSGGSLAKTNTAQSFTAPQRADMATVTDGTLDLNDAQNFIYTPSGADTLEFSNEAAGQSGIIFLTNGSNYAITLGAEIMAPDGTATATSATGEYVLTYAVEASGGGADTVKLTYAKVV